MDDPGFGFPDADSAFHINTPKGNNLPDAFQGDDEVEINFDQNNFEVDGRNFYQNVAHGLNGNNRENFDQTIHSVAITSQQAEACPIFDDGGVILSQNVSNQQYSMEYLSQSSVVTPSVSFANDLEPSQEAPFLNNIQQSGGCLPHFQSGGFSDSSAALVDNIPPVIEEAYSIGTDLNVGNFPGNSELIESDPNSEMLHPSAIAAPTESTAGPISDITEEMPLAPLQDNEETMLEMPFKGNEPVLLMGVLPLLENQPQQTFQINEDLSDKLVDQDLDDYPTGSTNLTSNQTSDALSNLNLSPAREALCIPQETARSFVESTSEGFDLSQLEITESNVASVENKASCAVSDIDNNADQVNEVCDILPDVINSKAGEEILTNPEELESDEVLISSSAPIPSEQARSSNAKEIPGENLDRLIAEDEQEKNSVSSTQEVTHENEQIDEVTSQSVSTQDCNQITEDKIEFQLEEKDKIGETSVSNETLDDLAKSLEEGIAATSENSIEGGKIKDVPEINKTIARSLSPMITVMDSTFGEGDELGESKCAPNTEEVGAVQGSEDTEIIPARVTRSGTGSLRTKSQRFVEEVDASDDSSQESFPGEVWEYEEGAELAPTEVDASISVSEKVLRVTPEEFEFYKNKFSNGGVNTVLKIRLHCTTCGRHIGAAPNRINLGHRHKVLRVLTCNRCHAFYGEGKFPKDSDGSELYCRWCGQGGQVICCSSCPNVFCKPCIKRNFGPVKLNTIAALDDWACFLCNYEVLWEARSICWALLTYAMGMKKFAVSSNDDKKLLELKEDKSRCCGKKKITKRKPQGKSKASGSNLQSSRKTDEEAPYNGFEFNHFLFSNDSHSSPLEATQEGSAEDDDYIDPSQFVQPVLEEPAPSVPKVRPAMRSRERPPQSSAHPAKSTVPPLVPRFRPIGPKQTIMTASGPRIFIRQGNLMQPGLVPINNQPNSINSVARPPQAALAGGVVRNPAHFLSNVEGVRSVDQVQALEQVPWFRDAIDNVRASTFALTKRIREMEARFHSLKNKQDIDKVMNLGKKLERLTSKTMNRYKQINLSLNEGSKSWYNKKLGMNGSGLYENNPFKKCSESLSDWDDDIELSKPLEKVMIPLNSSGLHGGGIRPSFHSSVLHGGGIRPTLNSPGIRPIISVRNPPPLIRTGVVRPRPPVTAQAIGRGQRHPPPIWRGPTPPQTVISSSNSASLARLPGPKSGVVRYRQLPVSPIPPGSSVLKRSNAAGVGAFLNERNGLNTVSVTLAPKRKRLESVSSDGSDVVVCPTIPELLEKYKIKPCKVVITKNDGFIASFLGNQEQIRQLNAYIESEDVTSSSEVDESFEVPEVETVMAEKPDASAMESSHIDSQNNGDDLTSNEITSNVVGDDDDDIEIIHEVSPSNKQNLPT